MAWDPSVPGPRLRRQRRRHLPLRRTTAPGPATWTPRRRTSRGTRATTWPSRPTDDNRLATGLQDNGSVRDWTAANPHPTDLSQFNSYGGGDGHWVAIDPNNSEHVLLVLAERELLGQHRQPNGTTTKWSFKYQPSGLRFTTDAPIGFDPSNTQTMYVGGTALLKSTDQGHTAFTGDQPDR